MPQSEIRNPDSGHIGVMDGVRACSILLVMAGHLLPLGPKVMQLNAVAAAGGMSLFFSLSGFLITRLLTTDNRLSDFFIKRLTRIVPLAYLYMAVIFLFFDHDVGALLRELSFSLNYNQQYADAYNTHLWSLCVEIQFYIVIGLLFAIFQKSAKWLLLALCVLLTVFRAESGASYSMMTHLRGDEILTGALLYLSVNGSFGDHRRFWGVMERSTPALALLLAATCHPAAGLVSPLRAYAASLLVGSIVFTRRKWLAAMLTSRPMAYIAKVSYALYIIHPAAASGALAGGPKWLLYLVKRPISLAITFVLAHVSTFHYEAYWMEMGRRVVRVRQAARSATASLGLAARPS